MPQALSTLEDVNEMPPAYQAPQQNKSRTTLIVVIVLVCVLVPCLCVVGGGAFAYFFAKKNVLPMVGCTITMTDARDAVVQYANQNDGKFPDAKTWQDDIKSHYAQLHTVEQGMGEMGGKTADEEWSCRPGPGDTLTGIAYNADLSGKKMADIKDPYATIVLFEVDKVSRNASAPYKERPEQESPAMFGEHMGWFFVPLQGDPDLTGSGKGKFKSQTRRR
jgi:hypothetical protein